MVRLAVNYKYALVNEATGQVTYLNAENAAEAFKVALNVNPKWKQEGLKLWVRVGGQS